MKKCKITKAAFAMPTVCLALGALASCGEKQGTEIPKVIADLVVFSNMYTAEEENDSEAQAFAVKDGKYIFVGSKEDADKYIEEGKTEVIDHSGLIVPGCTEGHAHYFDGTGLSNQLIGCNQSYEEVLVTLENEVKTHQITQFVSFGWNTVSLMQRRAAKYNFADEIESIAPGIPVVLIDNAGHAAVCNRTALEMAGVTKENPTVRGGEVDLLDDGTPTGYVGDQAVFYMTDKTISRPLNDDQYRKACIFAQNELLRYGYTNAVDAFTNMYDPTGLYEAIKKMDDDNELKINVAECFNIKSFDSKVYKTRVDEVVDIVDKYTGKHCNPAYIKLFADGVVESGTGWISHTYKNALPGKEHGNIIWEQPELDAIVTYANFKGLTVHTHTFGDAACHAMIDSYVTSNAINDGKFRNSLDHVRNIKTEDIDRCAENDIPVAANLIWHYDYSTTDPEAKAVRDKVMDNIGEDYYMAGYPMKSLIDKGVLISSSTDAPAAMDIEGNILNVIEVATTGKAYNNDAAPFATHELLSVKEALKALTIDGAWLLGLENERGSIKVGKYADFVMIDKDFLNYKGDELGTIHNAKILKTYFEGKNVFTYNPTSNPDSKFVS
ncbi:MAG: amidohydrolase family protein [Bacilli bacterium]|nr:amidohydrolase family protein [Bacilli bacterium]